MKHSIKYIIFFILFSYILDNTYSQNHWWQREIPTPSANQKVNPNYVNKKRELEQLYDQINKLARERNNYARNGQTEAVKNADEMLQFQGKKMNRLEYELSKLPIYINIENKSNNSQAPVNRVNKTEVYIENNIVTSNKDQSIVKNENYNSPSLFYCDFSNLPAGETITNLFNLEAVQCDNNPIYKGSIRFLSSVSKFKASFNIHYLQKNASLDIIHLSSYSEEAYANGYSPVTVKINGRVLFENYSPKSHQYITDTWNIGDYLKIGENTIEFIANDLETHYWLKKIQITTY